MTDSAPTWQILQKSADRARQGADHARAIELYTQALAQADIPWEAIRAMWMARADSRHMLGDTAGMDADLTALAEQAAQRGDDVTRSTALTYLADVLRYTGEFERAIQVAAQGLQAAERTGQVGLRVKALCSQCSSLANQLNLEAAEACLNSAEIIASPSDPDQQIFLCRATQNLEWRKGRIAQARQAAEEGLRLVRETGNRYEEGRILNTMYIVTPDLAEKGAYLEQALQAFTGVGARLYQNMILLNSCSWWAQVGLYSHAAEAARQALQTGEAMEQESDVLYALQNLAASLTELGYFSEAVSDLEAALRIAQKLNDSIMEFGMYTLLATIALYQDQPQSARSWLQQVEERIKEYPAQFQVVLNSLQAVIARLCGDEITARRLAQQALEKINPEFFGGADYQIEQAAWWCYRTLADDSAGDISEDAWRALDLGRQALLVPIEHCSDAGLGRGYLHRDRYHRLLVREWLRHAPAHGVDAESLAAFAAAVQRPGRLDDVFRRLLGVGVRLNAQRDPALLPGQIVDDVAELIGAERIALLLLAPDETRHTTKTLLPIPPFPAMNGKVEPKPDEAAFLAEIEPCIEEASLTRQGFVRRINPDGSLTEQRSLLVAPLLSQNRLVGLIYCDLTGCFGRLERDDLDLLTVLANQSAVAVENADWSATLEHKVAERTAELEQSTNNLQQRNGELTIINSIQQGLAAELDFQAIVNLVGDKLSEVLHTGDLGIRWIDENTNTVHYLYEREHGRPLTIPSTFMKFGGIWEEMIKTRQPLIVNTIADMKALGVPLVPGTDQCKSMVDVPIVYRDRFIGVIHDENFEREYAYGESELRLLTTIAGSLGAALENARLFAETQRLFKAEQERVGELQIINSIQQGLASQLEYQSILDLVGDRIHEIFSADCTTITLYDREKQTLCPAYCKADGIQETEFSPRPLGKGITSRVVESRQPLLINTRQEAENLGALIVMVGNKEDSTYLESDLLVPWITAGEISGVISVERVKAHAFTENDLRLLSTLVASMSAALENARLFAETQRLFKAEQERVAELAILNSVGEAMAKTMDVKTVARIVGDKVRDIFGSAVVSISLLDPHTNLVNNQYEYDRGEGGYVDYIEPLPLGIGMSSKVINTRQSLLLGTLEDQIANGAYSSPKQMELASSNMVQSWLGVPILTGDRVLGIVVLADYQVNAFNENHVRLLQTLSANMGVAIENARLFQAEQERVGELQIINSIQQGLAAELDFQAIVNLVGDKLSEVLHTGDLGIRWYDENTHMVHCLYEREHGLPLEMPSVVLKPGGILDQMMITRQPVVVNTLAELMALGVTLVPGTDQCKSSVDVPIISSDRFIGVIHDENFEREYAYGEAELRLLTTIAGSLGSALENARLFAETQRLFKAEQERVGELQIINSIQQGLAAELDFQAIVDLVGDKLREVFHTQELGINWYDEKTGLLQTLYNYEHGERLQPMAPRPPSPNGPFIRQLKTHQPVVFKTAEEGDDLSPTIPGTDTSKSGAFIPVISGDRVLGTIRVENYEREYAYGEAELRLLTTVAASLGSALENARLFAETQRLFNAEQERVAELAILNSVGEGMAKTMDVKTVARIVGDKVRDIFDAPIVSISLLNLNTNTVINQYEYDRGEGGYVDFIEPIKLGAGLTSKVINLRQPLLFGTDAEQKANGAYIPHQEAELMSGVIAESWLGVPILSGDRVLGIVVLADYRVNAFNENHVHLLQTLSSNMGVAIENARLFQAEQERVAELQIINSIQQGLAAELDFEAIIDLVGDKLREVLHNEDIGITWFDEKANLVHYMYAYEHGKRLKVDPMPPRPGGLFEQMSKTHQPIVFNTLEEAKAYTSPLTGTDQSKSSVYIPIISSDRLLGDMSLDNFEHENAFGEAELRLLTTIAASLGTALENARLFAETQRLLEESQRRMDQLTMLSEVGRTLSSTLQVNELLQLIYEQIQRVMYAENMYIALYQPSTDEVEFAFSRNVDEVRPGERSSAKEGIISYILRSHQPVFIHGNFAEIEQKLEIKLVGIPAASWLGVPLLLGERVLGVIAVQHYSDPDAYDDTHLMLLQAIAGQAAVALENARLYVDADWRAGQMATLAEAGREITASHDLQAIMQKITQRAHEVCRARSTILRLADTDRQVFYTSVALGEYADQFMSDVITPGHGITGSIIVSGLPEIIQDPRSDPRMTHVPGTPEEEEHPETMMIAPLVVRGQAVGVLTLYRWMSDGYFTPVDLNFLSGLARQTAIAIENLRLLEETQEAQRRMADIINFLPDAALVIDRDGRVIAWNRAIEEMTGKKAEDMLGKGDYEYAKPFYGDRRPILIDLVLLPDEKVETGYAQIRREGSVLTGETFVPMLNGRPAYLYANASALRNARGEIMGAIETIRDISERKRSEQELHQAKAEAEEARREAEAATQAKSAFLATMSHEIRTPMNAIIGMSGLLLNTPLDTQQREFADIIRISGDSLLTIINDILDFSKIEAGKLDLEYITFDLRESLESTIDLLATRAAEKKLDLAVEISPGVPAAIVSDVTRLRQVLLNLLNNAVKFTDHGEVVLSVDCAGPEATSESGEITLHFAVRDTGIGIPADRLDRLFQSFSQVDASTSRKYGGTGLGLAISKRLAEMMGGKMWVESTDKVGSTFHFTIRAKPGTLNAPAGAQFNEQQPNLTGRRILVVDDNPTNRRIISLQTHDWGMLARETGSPAEALEWLRRGDPFDLAILDFHMPEMDGLTLAQEMRKLRDAKSLPLVLLSSLGGRETGQGPDAFNWAARLTKPVKQSQLFNILATIFGQAETPARSQAAAATAKAALEINPLFAQRCPLRILLVEDMPFNQKLAVHLLKQMGYTTDLASNGLEAIQSVERQEYDVVLMDVQMPEMDGLEATRQICARWPVGKRPRIIAMTANAMQGDLEICLAAGMDDYVAKPIRVQELAAALERASKV